MIIVAAFDQRLKILKSYFFYIFISKTRLDSELSMWYEGIYLL